MSKPQLRLDWVNHKAARYAAMKWHYSTTLSAGKNVYIGVWEDGQYIGVIVFGLGSGNATNGTRFGLARNGDLAELTRVALNKHKTPVSRIIAIALRMLRKQSPRLRLLISMADPKQGHHGGIYQAGGWIYTGTTKPDVEYFSNGQWVHHRTATARGSAAGLPSRPLPPKYRYLMPLDDAMREQIAPLAKPYPKRQDPRAGSVDSDTSAFHVEEGGANPTPALQREAAD